jgi:hypothetical protein
VAERLGRGLQNLVRRFESAPDLNDLKALFAIAKGAFFFAIDPKLMFEVVCKGKRPARQGRAEGALKRPHFPDQSPINPLPTSTILKM